MGMEGWVSGELNGERKRRKRREGGRAIQRGKLNERLDVWAAE